MATPSLSRLAIRPPDKGSFPLDHDGECKDIMERYMTCLKKTQNDSHLCREDAKAYLKCRMERNLMANESWDKLGFSSNDSDKSKGTKS